MDCSWEESMQIEPNPPGEDGWLVITVYYSNQVDPCGVANPQNKLTWSLSWYVSAETSDGIPQTAICANPSSTDPAGYPQVKHNKSHFRHNRRPPNKFAVERGRFVTGL